RVLRANSPKGGDAKPPVYGTNGPMTAGLPARTLTHWRAGHQARELPGCAPILAIPGYASSATRNPSASVATGLSVSRGRDWTWRSTYRRPPFLRAPYVRLVAVLEVPSRTQAFCVSRLTFYLTMRCYIVTTALTRGQRFQA